MTRLVHFAKSTKTHHSEEHIYSGHQDFKTVVHNYNQNDQTNFVSRKTAESNAIYDHPELL